MAHDVFISHSSKDKIIADAVCSILEQNKVRCWVAPRDVTPGRSYAACITQAIKASKVLIIIFSSNSNASEPVTSELEIAMKNGVIIIPFRIENIKPSDELDYYLSSRHWLDAITSPIEQHIYKLVQITQAFICTADTNDRKTKFNASPGQHGIVEVPQYKFTEDEDINTFAAKKSPMVEIEEQAEEVEEDEVYEDVDFEGTAHEDTEADSYGFDSTVEVSVKSELTNGNEQEVLNPFKKIIRKIFIGVGLIACVFVLIYFFVPRGMISTMTSTSHSFDQPFSIENYQILNGQQYTRVVVGVENTGNMDRPSREAYASLIRNRLAQLNFSKIYSQGDNQVVFEYPNPTSADVDIVAFEAMPELTLREILENSDNSTERGSVIINGENVTSFRVENDSERGSENMEAILNSSGTIRFAEATERLVGKKIGIFLDNTLISSPTVLGKITGGKFFISLGQASSEKDKDMTASLVKYSIAHSKAFKIQETETTTIQ